MVEPGGPGEGSAEGITFKYVWVLLFGVTLQVPIASDVFVGMLTQSHICSIDVHIAMVFWAYSEFFGGGWLYQPSTVFDFV